VGARPVVVLSRESSAARSLVNGGTVAMQDPPRGTGDAVRVALDAVKDSGGDVLIVYGDTPLVRAEALRALRDRRTSRGVELAAAEDAMRRRIRERHMLAGVTFHDPSSSLVDADVELAPDVTVERGSILEGKTTVGAGTRIGPYSIVRDSTIGANCRVEAS